MARWTCPRCDREFGRARQAHTCLPGGTVADSFAGRPPGQRAVYDALIAHLRTLGPVHEDAVGVGVFLKRTSKLAEVRPQARWVSLAIVLPRAERSEAGPERPSEREAQPVPDPRIDRVIRIGADRVAHFVKLATVDDVDDQVRAWLTAAYAAAG